MKRLILVIVAVVTWTGVMAQGPHRKFDPERFQAEMEQYITREACLTPGEAKKFFPLYREMMQKQRALFGKNGGWKHVKPVDENACRSAILQKDDVDLQIKQLQQQYHLRFLELLPASKIYDIIKAEEKFHRESVRKMAGKREQK